MPAGFPRSPLLAKGAFIQLAETVLGATPNVIVFQYNPETMTRSFEPWRPADPNESAKEAKPDPHTQPYDPQETFRLVLELDASDAMEDPLSNPLQAVYGVADRLAALERLLYPFDDTGNLLTDMGASLTGKADPKAPRALVPIVLFSFGPNLIVPVRLVSYEVVEQAYSPLLYPIRAQVSIGCQVLSDADFPTSGPNMRTSAAAELARAAYQFTRKQREILAVANIGSAATTILGLLPF